MRFTPVMAFDEVNGRWKTIGVFAVNIHGIAIVKINKRDPLVVSTPAYRSIEEVYNKEFEEGEVTYYNRPPGENMSEIVHLSTSDAQFLEKYGEQLEQQRKFLRLGEIRAIKSENITEHMDRLLQEVIQDGAGSETATSG